MIRKFLVLFAALLLTVAPVFALTFSNSTSATVAITSSESLTLTATLSGNNDINAGTSGGTIAGNVTVAWNYYLNSGHNGLYLYSWVSNASTFYNYMGPSSIFVTINGGGNQTCNASAASQTNTPGMGVDGQYCGTGFTILAPASFTSPQIASSSASYIVGITGNYFANSGGNISNFTVNWEAEAF